MKKLVLFTLLLISGFWVFSQQDAQFSQNMFNKLSVNPGSAGHNGGFCGTLITRTQWMGFDGRPQTHQFSGDGRFNQHGFGLTIAQDKLGVEKSTTAKIAYAYHLNIGAGELGIGLDLGLINKAFGGGFFGVDDYTTDPRIPNEKTSSVSFDLGLGLYYQIKEKLYVGISTSHIPESTFKDDANLGGIGSLNYEQKRHYFIMGGYDYDLSGGSNQWVLKPSVFIKTDLSSTQLDVNALVEYNKLIWGGLSYRLDDAIAILAGVNVPQLPGLKVGLAYDFTTSSIGNHSSGSLELMVRYCKNIVPKIKREEYHSVRFL